jgi:hypothetical protein
LIAKCSSGLFNLSPTQRPLNAYATQHHGNIGQTSIRIPQRKSPNLTIADMMEIFLFSDFSSQRCCYIVLHGNENRSAKRLQAPIQLCGNHHSLPSMQGDFACDCVPSKTSAASNI